MRTIRMHRNHTPTFTRKISRTRKRKHKHGAGLFKGAYSMKPLWEPIWAQLTKLQNKKKFKCVMCHTDLPRECKYISVMNKISYKSLISKTNNNTLIIRKYNLPSALRDGTGFNVINNIVKSTVGTFQPTIFYFHCPYCGFLHQFKSSVQLIPPPHNSSSRSSNVNDRRKSYNRRSNVQDRRQSYNRRSRSASI